MEKFWICETERHQELFHSAQRSIFFLRCPDFRERVSKLIHTRFDLECVCCRPWFDILTTNDSPEPVEGRERTICWPRQYMVCQE